MATSWTWDDLAALEAAIKKGVKSVSYGDRRVEYNSMAEMLQLRAAMRQELDDAAGSSQSQAIYAGRVQ